MSSLKFDNVLVNGSKGINLLTVDQAQGDLKIKWPSIPGEDARPHGGSSSETRVLGQYYTVLVYDLDAPYPSNPNKSPFLHYLVVNVQDNFINSGQTLAEYIAPYPPTDSPPHRYMVEVYAQQNLKTGVMPPSSRDNFDIRKYTTDYGDGMISAQQFKVGHILPTASASALVSQQYVPTPVPQTFAPTPVLQTFAPTPVPQTFAPIPANYVPFVVPTNNPTNSYNNTNSTNSTNNTNSGNTHSNSSKSEYFKGGTDLGERQQKYCRCVLHAAAKQPDWCLEDKAWREQREGSTCYNPYAVCAKSTGASSRSCGVNYDYQNLPDDELIAYAQLSKVNIPMPYNRQQIINNIMAWKAGKS